MAGASYLGHTQWAVAPYADPPLVSVSLNITTARFSEAFYEHGAPSLQNALNWTGQVGRQERGPLAVIPNPRQMARMKRALRKVPLQAADVDVAGAPVAFWRDFTGHAAPADGFWAGADHDQADLGRLPPVSMVTGWWDLFLPGQLRDYQAIRAAGVTARITIGPWLHGEPGELKEITRQDIAWLDHHLRRRPAAAGPTGAGLPPAGGHLARFRRLATAGRRHCLVPARVRPPEPGRRARLMRRPARSSTTPRTRRPRPAGPSCGRPASRSTTRRSRPGPTS